MYDFWFALGTAVMKPELLNAIQAKTAQAPLFTKLNSRSTIEVNSEGKIEIFTDRRNAGLLDPDQTQKVRGAIRDFLKDNPAAPPISIFTAARFCQFMTIEFFRPAMKFGEWLAGANTAYKEALGGQTGPMSERFPALIGLCQVDRDFAMLLRGETSKTTPASMLPEFLDEFRANPAEAQIAKKFVTAPGAKLLSDAASGNWQMCCPGEQVAFADPQNRRTIMSD